jgi:hypothetical protein
LLLRIRPIILKEEAIKSRQSIKAIGCDTVQSSPGSREGKPGPAGPGLKNIETGLDWKPGRSGLGTRQAAKPAKKTLY